MIKLYRDDAEILIVLMNSSEPVSGAVLCEKTSFGIKTLKGEIKYLNQMCQENGCIIRSVTGSGYLLEVEDEDVFEKFRIYLEGKYYNNMLYRNAKSERVHFIIRRILANGKVYIQDLALQCLCSESTISRDMKDVKERLNSYNLSISNHTNHGIILTGREWNIRLAIVNEYNLYHTFVKVEYLDTEPDFAKMLLADGAYNQMVKDRVSLILSNVSYHLPHTTGYKLANLMILAITRRKNADGLSESADLFMKIECEYEKEIIQQAFDNLPSLARIQLNALESQSLAAYLKSNRVYKYSEFLSDVREEDRIKVTETVDGFLAYVNEFVDISPLDTTVIRKDMCCELTRFMYRNMLEVQPGVSYADNFRRDGLITYDLCMLLYKYLNTRTDIRLTRDDCVQFYYIFSDFLNLTSQVRKKTILIVTRTGFYSSRNLANRISNNAVLKNIVFIPMEHTRLNEVNMSEVDGIVTDIREIRERYNYKNNYDIQNFRRYDEISRFVNQIRIPLNYLRNELLTVNDIYYSDEIRTENDFFRYLKETILEDCAGSKQYMEAINDKAEISDARRINNFAVYNLVHDYLGRDFIKIIFLSNEMSIGNDKIDKIIIFNAKGSSIIHLSEISEIVAKLLHANDLLSSFDLEKDHKLIESIVYR